MALRLVLTRSSKAWKPKEFQIRVMTDNPPPSHPSGLPLSTTQAADLPGLPTHADGAPPGARVGIETGQVLAGRYEVRARLGAGGMGAVYRAFDRNRQEEIAIKVLLPGLLKNESARQRFQQEATLSSKLSHPHIVNVFDVQHDGEYHFLTMECLEGETLRQRMERMRAAGEVWSVDEASEIVAPLVDALSYAHGKGAVHRDVKPENVFLAGDAASPTVKILDFGIARLMSTTQLTMTGAALGTAYYMAPEQLGQPGQVAAVDGRSDQYSLGTVLYELLSGKLPTGRAKPLCELRRDVSRGFSDAIDRALESDPGDRFPDMQEFRAALNSRGSTRRPLFARAGLSPRVMASLGGIALLALAVAYGSDLWSWGTRLYVAIAGDKEAERAAMAEAEAELASAIALIEAVQKKGERLRPDLERLQSGLDRLEQRIGSHRGSDEELETLRARLAEEQREARESEVTLNHWERFSGAQFVQLSSLVTTGSSKFDRKEYRPSLADAVQASEIAGRLDTWLDGAQQAVRDLAHVRAGIDAFEAQHQAFDHPYVEAARRLADSVDEELAGGRMSESTAMLERSRRLVPELPGLLDRHADSIKELSLYERNADRFEAEAPGQGARSIQEALELVRGTEDLLAAGDIEGAEKGIAGALESARSVIAPHAGGVAGRLLEDVRAEQSAGRPASAQPMEDADALLPESGAEALRADLSYLLGANLELTDGGDRTLAADHFATSAALWAALGDDAREARSLLAQGRVARPDDGPMGDAALPEGQNWAAVAALYNRAAERLGEAGATREQADAHSSSLLKRWNRDAPGSTGSRRPRALAKAASLYLEAGDRRAYATALIERARALHPVRNPPGDPAAAESALEAAARELAELPDERALAECLELLAEALRANTRHGVGALHPGRATVCGRRGPSAARRAATSRRHASILTSGLATSAPETWLSSSWRSKHSGRSRNRRGMT